MEEHFFEYYVPVGKGIKRRSNSFSWVNIKKCMTWIFIDVRKCASINKVVISEKEIGN